MKKLLDGYFTSKAYIEIEFFHEAFIHNLRGMELLGDIEDYSAKISIRDIHAKYLIYDLKMILEVFSYILQALKRAKEKAFIEDDIPQIIHKDIEDLKILLGIPEGKFEKTLYVGNLFDLKKLLGSLLESLLFPHFLLNQIEDSENLKTWNNFKNAIKSSINKDFIYIPIDLGTFDNFLVKTYDTVEKIKETTKKYTNTVLNDTKDFLSSFLFMSGIFVAGFYITRKAIDYVFTRKNPPENLFEYAKKMKPDIKKYDFDRAISVFRAQHGRMPNISDIKMVRQPPGINLPICVEVGKVPQITYDPPSGKKSPYKYKHDMYDTKLVSDTSGNNLFLIGKTYLDTSDGWLKK